MTLARDVFRNDNKNGIPICGKDTLLTDSLLARLEHLDVQSVYVEGHPVWEDGDCSLDDLLGDLERRFSKTLNNPLNLELLEIYKAYLTASMGDDGG